MSRKSSRGLFFPTLLLALIAILLIFTSPSFVFADGVEGKCVLNCGETTPVVPLKYLEPPPPSRPLTSEEKKAHEETLKRQEKVRKHYDKGIKCSNMGKFDCALKSFKKALEFSPDNPNLMRALALALNDKGREAYQAKEFEMAVGYYREALKYMPDDPTIVEDLGRAWGMLILKTEEEKRSSDALH